METRVLIPSSLTIVVSALKSASEKAIDPDDEELLSPSSLSPSVFTPKKVHIKKEPLADEDDDEETEVAVTTSDDEDEDDDGGRLFSPRRRNSKRKLMGGCSDYSDSTPTTTTTSSKIGCFIVAKHFLPKGTIFHANEGGIQLLPDLGEEQLPPLGGHDIRLVFGCVDRLITESGRRFRVCNWLRFLSTPQDDEDNDKESSKPNIIGSFTSGQVDFTTSKDIGQGEQLIANFDISSLAQLHQGIGGGGSIKSDSNNIPLDLSKISASSGGDKEDTHKKDKDLHFHSDEDKFHNHHHHHHHHNHHKRHHEHRYRLHETTTSKKVLSSPPTPPPSKRGGIIPFSISAVLASSTTGAIGGSGGDGMGGRLPILRTRGRERSLLPCEVCGKAFDRPSLLKRHMRTHTGEKPHICDVCGKGFSTSSSLNTHRRIHSGEKPHQCPVCGKRFTASSNLYYHRMTHNKEKPHKCLLCGKSFPTPGDLKSHQYVHSGSWPYTCPICHRGFSKQTNLRNHLLLHSGDKPHNCHLCSKKFALACNLRAHLRTHEEEDLVSTVTSGGGNSKKSAAVMSPLKSETSPEGGGGGGGVSSSSSSSFLPYQHHHHPALSFLGGSTTPTLYNSTSSSAHHTLLPPPMNPFLEQLFQWNYRFAKETAGSLSMMQQKLLESQMLAAHLMIGQPQEAAVASQQGVERLLPLVPFSVSDLIRATSGGGISSSTASGRMMMMTANPLLGTTQTQHGGERASLFSQDLNKFIQ